MKSIAVILSFVLIFALFAVACSRQETTENIQPGTEDGAEPEAETAQYIDGQLVNPDETIEIGEMI